MQPLSNIPHQLDMDKVSSDKMPTLSEPHYSNVILIGQDGKLLSTISSRKAKWYLKKNLAVEIPAPAPYSRALQINFTHNQPKEAESWDLGVNDNQCVICGCEDLLTLHHIVPRVVRRYFPVEIKGHSREWCVLLCEPCHTKVELITQPIYKVDFPDYVRQKDDWKVSLQVIKDKGNMEKIPVDKLKEMLASAGYSSIDDIPPLSPEDKKNLYALRSSSHQKTIEEWANKFIQDHDGIEGTQQYFLNLFLACKPQYLPEWFADLVK